MQHVIKKQVMYIGMDSKADAFRIQHDISRHYWQDVLPFLEKIFDQSSLEEETVHIDHLALDLGELSEKTIAGQRWGDDILQRLAEQLRKQLAGVTDDSPKPSQEPRAANVFRQWLFYMENGYLPWNTVEPDSSWENEVLEALAVDYAQAAFLQKLIRLNPFSLKRIVAQHDEKFLLRLIDILTAKKQTNFPGLLETWTVVWQRLGEVKKEISIKKKSAWRQALWMLALQTSFEAQQHGSFDESFVQKVLGKFQLTPAGVSAVFVESGMRKTSLFRLLKKLPAKSTNKTSKATPGMETAPPDDQEPEAPGKEPEIDGEGIFVENAGIVLLHPFLGTLFKRLLLVKNGKFPSFEARQKALYVLHYLATGETKAQEHELVMVKTLCGYPLAMPVDKQVRLGKKDKEEAGHLLDEAIRQWEALKNTSGQGLQEAFLQRKGKLFTKNNNLRLMVETATIDVLLDRLPWGLGIVKLPWMEDILRVDWR